MASIDICYAVAAYKSVTESLTCSTRYMIFSGASADFETIDLVTWFRCQCDTGLARTCCDFGGGAA
jgi:hypothetical protein